MALPGAGALRQVREVVIAHVNGQDPVGDGLQAQRLVKRHSITPLVYRTAGNTKRPGDGDRGIIEMGNDSCFKHRPQSTAC